jgi:RNA polymerase sigma-70 factor (ECF subfamily)
VTGPSDSDDFARLVRPHFDRLYRLAWRLAGGESEAEDLFQELMVKALAGMDRLRTLDDPGPWLARMLYNLFVDQHRRFARRRLVIVDEGRLDGDGLAGIAGDADPERDSRDEELAGILEEALAALSEEHRIVLLLHDADGYTIPEIQALTGTPAGTIKSRLHRARVRMRALLEGNGTLSGAGACNTTDPEPV